MHGDIGLVPTFGHIQVEEVTVKDGLYNSRHHWDLVIEVLCLVPSDPIGQIEQSIEPQEEQVVSGDGLSLSSLADHEELWQDSHWLQIDGEGPEDLSEQ